ncbi:ribonuclease H-like domain-containing protein [Tanacetum coccineum]|uniref:Ribonuclease H-like domain-containing protein n=1 Tax=Tanacetum coccineum TaxID=301880 RepID=A0ABQ5BTI0_9ASTR
MEFESAQSGTTAKLPILKLGEYESWVIRIRQYFQIQDYALWDFIENGNSLGVVPQTTQEKVSTLMLKQCLLPLKHDLEVTRFGGNATTKKTQKTLLKQQYENFNATSAESLDSIFNRLQKIVSRLAILGVIIAQEDLNLNFLSSLLPDWNTHVVVWMNKPEVETMSIDNLDNNFKIVKQKIKKTVGTSSGVQNLALMTAPSSNNTNDANTASSQVTAASPSDLEQIYEDDLEAIDLKWQLSLLSVRAKKYYQKTGKKIFINGNDIAGYDKSKVECYNCDKLGHFAKECRAPRSKEGQFRKQDNARKQGNNEYTSKAMLAIDGVGFDWSDMAEEQVQTNMTLMAFLDSEVYTDKTCSKTCLKNYKSLKKQYDDLVAKQHQTEFKAITYKKGLDTIEAQLITYRKNEVLFSEEVVVLKREVGIKQYEINMLKTEFEKVKQEKDAIDFKIEKFGKASKDLDQLLGSQKTDKSKKGFGNSDVPPPHPLIYNRPNKLDLSYSGLGEFKEPEFKGYGPENSKKESNVICENESDNSKENSNKSLVKEQVSQDKSIFVEGCGSNTSKSVSKVKPKKVRKNDGAPIIEDWVSDDEEEDESKPKSEKKTVIPTAAKIEFVKPEKPVKKSVRYAEMYRSQFPRGNQRNWNGQKSNQLGKDFVMYNKACYICGSFNHLQYNCHNHQRRGIIYRNNYNRVHAKNTHPNVLRNMSPKAVLLNTGLTPLNTVKPVYTAHPKPTVHCARPKTHFYKSAQSTVQRPFYKKPALTNRHFNHKVNTVRPRIVNTARSYRTPVNTVRPRVLMLLTSVQTAQQKNSTCSERFNAVEMNGTKVTTNQKHLGISKEVGTPRYLSLVVPLKKVDDEAVHKELGDRMERAATTAYSLEAEQDSGSGLRCQDTILGDVDAQTRFEITSKQSNDPPLSRGYTLGSGEDSMKQLELMELFNAARLMLMSPIQVPAAEGEFINTLIQESDGFAEIIDFLKASSVHYALTVNPIIYTSCIEQFWATAKVQTVNGVRQLQALVDKKRVIITESSIRSDLHLDDAEGTDCLPTVTIFEELTRMGAKSIAWNEFSCSMASLIICLATNQKFNLSKYIFDAMVKHLDGGKVFANMKRPGKDFSGRITPLFDTMMVQASEEVVLDLEKSKDAQAKEITTLKKRIQKLEMKKMSTPTGLKRLKKVVLDADEMHVEAKVDKNDEQNQSTNLKLLLLTTCYNTTTPRPNPKGGIGIQEPNKRSIALDEQIARDIQAKLDDELIKEQKLARKQEKEANIALIEEELIDEEKGKLFMELMKKKRKHFAALRAQEKRNRPPTKAQKRTQMSTYLKHMGTESKENRYKEDRKETAKAAEKNMLRRKRDENSAIDAITTCYQTTSDIDYNSPPLHERREALEALWGIVKTKYSDIRPEDEFERVLWDDLKVMFEPDKRSDVWRIFQGYRVTIWKLIDSSGVHFVSNTVANLRDDVKAITTRSGVAYDGPMIPPTPSPPPKEVERETEATKDNVQPTSLESTAHVQPSVVQDPIPKPEVAPKPKPKPTIPYPSRLNDQKLREKANNQMLKFLSNLSKISLRIFFNCFAMLLLHMPKFASTFKSLLSNKEKLFELANNPV